MIEAFVAAALLLATAALTVAERRSSAALAHQARRIEAARTVQAEAQRLHVAERQLSDAQRLSEAAVSGGTLTVRAIHKGIAAIPFTILENIPVTRDTTRIVRISHDLISDAVYGTIDAVNRGVGAGLRAGLDAGANKPRKARAPDSSPGGESK